MPVHGISGIPGHGKTSLMMEALVAAAELNAKHLLSGKPQLTINGVELLERPLYAAGIDGLEDGLANQLEDPTKWEDLPDGSLVFVDEAWKWFGHQHDARGAKPPQHVLGFAEHRHKAMDFWMTFQSPKQLYPFLRPLVGPHWHVVRRFGTPLIDVYKWGELIEEVQSQTNRDRGVKETRTLPTKQRKRFKSASGHTIKAQIPTRLIVGALAVLLVLPVGYFAIQALRPERIAANVTGAPEASLLADGATPTDGPKRPATGPMTAEQYAAQLEPRIAGVHGTQPIFDGRQVQAVPSQICFISGEAPETTCRCVTEQVTPVYGVQDQVCRQWALHGRYDPYKAPAIAVAAQPERKEKPPIDGPQSAAQGKL